MNQDHFFFVHVMKAGGSSFINYAQQSLGRASVWPGVDQSGRHRLDYLIDDDDLNKSVTHALSLFTKIEPGVFTHLPTQAIRLFAGHIPFASRYGLRRNDRLPHCLALLRHPVERVSSHLVQDLFYRRADGLTRPEHLYNHAEWYGAYARNYQTKLFSMTVEETFAGDAASSIWKHVMGLLTLVMYAPYPEQRQRAAREIVSLVSAVWDVLDTELEEVGVNRMAEGRTFPHSNPLVVDETRLEHAMAALEECAVVGVTEHLGMMARAMQWGFGWSARGVKLANKRAVNIPVPAWLRKQIARDNEEDMALYGFARKLAFKQQRARHRYYSLP